MQNSFCFYQNDDDEMYEMSTTSILSRFEMWVVSRDTNWLNDEKSDVIINAFMVGYDGLNSKIQDEDKQRFFSFMKPYIYNAKYN